MIIFYSDNVTPSMLTLTPEESSHCVRVLRHRVGDDICVVDGRGNMYECRLADADPKAATAAIRRIHRDWNSRPYHLVVAVCPTKNGDRMEWFVEKAVELGVDEIVPLLAERSERRQFRKERLEKISLSAAKQSLKAQLPRIRDAVTLPEFLEEGGAGLKMIACCYDGPDYPRRSIVGALSAYLASCPPDPAPVYDSSAESGRREPSADSSCPPDPAPVYDSSAESGRREPSADSFCPPSAKKEITILIGPEGDFSEAELAAALRAGYIPVHLGPSRLRTETAALMGVSAVYSAFID